MESEVSKRVTAAILLVLAVIAALAALAGCGSGKPVAQHCDMSVQSGEVTAYLQSPGTYTAAQCASAVKAASGTALPALPGGLRFVCTDDIFDVYMTPAQIVTLQAAGLNPETACDNS